MREWLVDSRLILCVTRPYITRLEMIGSIVRGVLATIYRISIIKVRERDASHQRGHGSKSREIVILESLIKS